MKYNAERHAYECDCRDSPLTVESVTDAPEVHSVFWVDAKAVETPVNRLTAICLVLTSVFLLGGYMAAGVGLYALAVGLETMAVLSLVISIVAAYLRL